MHAYRNEVQELFGLLGYIVKSKDPDGIEIRFTMSCTRKDRARNTGQLLSTLKNVPYSGTSNIRSQLGEILQDYHAKLRDQNSPRSLFNRWRSPRLARRQVVYILTDGVWQPECDPAPIIKDLVDSLLQNHMQREQFGIQFIRFGNDPDGIIRLNQLDSGLGLSMYATYSLCLWHGVDDSSGTLSIQSLRTGTSTRCFLAPSTTGLTTMMLIATAVRWLPPFMIHLRL